MEYEDFIKRKNALNLSIGDFGDIIGYTKNGIIKWKKNGVPIWVDIVLKHFETCSLLQEDVAYYLIKNSIKNHDAFSKNSKKLL